MRELEDEPSTDRTPWIVVKLSLVKSHKTLKLRDILKISRREAIGVVVDLLIHTHLLAWETGDLSKWSDEYLEEILEWQGDPGGLIAAFKEAGFMEPGEGKIVHQWLRTQGVSLRHRMSYRKDRVVPVRGRSKPIAEDDGVVRQRTADAVANRKRVEQIE